MENVLTLVAGTPGALDHSMVMTAREALTAAGAAIASEDWLAPGQACDMPFEGPGPGEAVAAVRAALDGEAIDLVAQPVEGRRKLLLVADMESTIIENEMLDELAAELGLGDRIAAITARAMRGEIEFGAALAERVGMLAGVDAGALDRLHGRIRVSPGARALVATMRANGAWCALVSGGFTAFSGHVADLLGFDSHQANRLEIVDGKLTGRIVKPIIDRHAKQSCLLTLIQERGLSPRAAMAVGDGANDLAMVLAAGLGVAYHAKPILAAAAAMRVDHGDLTAPLYAQGYRRDEIVEGN